MMVWSTITSADALVIKPVYPLGFENVTLINRFIVPFLGIDANVGGIDLGGIPTPVVGKII